MRRFLAGPGNKQVIASEERAPFYGVSTGTAQRKDLIPRGTNRYHVMTHGPLSDANLKTK